MRERDAIVNALLRGRWVDWCVLTTDLLLKTDRTGEQASLSLEASLIMAENYFQEVGAFKDISVALTVGAPGVDLLVHTKDILQKATDHRLVSLTKHNS